MMGLSEVSQYIRSRIWDSDLDRLPPWLSIALRSIRILWAVVRDLHSGELSLRAMSLVYTTILSLVPLLAISFSVLKGLRSAFAGAFVAGLMWNMASVFFAKFVVSSAQYTAIYSAFAALIIFMLWLYIGWLVLLAGASSAYYHQHPERVSLVRGEPTLSVRMLERLAFALLTAIVNQFTNADPRSGAEELAGELNVPTSVVQSQIHALSQAGLIVATADDPPRWMPARAPETILLSEVMATIRKDGETPGLVFDKIAVPPIADRLLSDIEQRHTEILSQLSLADLVDPDEDGPSPDNSVAMLRVKRGPGDAAE